MIAVNCTVTRGEAAVCVVFNVVCGRVRFNTIEEGPDRRRPRCEVRILVYGSAYIHIVIPVDRSRKRCPLTAQRTSNRKRRHRDVELEGMKRRSRALHADAACDPV
jgi:hypothetical protein